MRHRDSCTEGERVLHMTTPDSVLQTGLLTLCHDKNTTVHRTRIGNTGGLREMNSLVWPRLNTARFIKCKTQLQQKTGTHDRCTEEMDTVHQQKNAHPWSDITRHDASTVRRPLHIPYLPRCTQQTRPYFPGSFYFLAIRTKKWTQQS